MVNDFTYLEPFLQTLGKQLTLAEISRRLGSTHQTSKAHLELLASSGLLRRERQGRLRLYSMNLDNPELFEALSICEKGRLLAFLEKRPLFSRMYESVFSGARDSGTPVLLFGSAVEKGDFSDIDLLILGRGERIRRRLSEFSRTYSLRINPIFSGEEHIAKTLLAEIRSKHIIIAGHDLALEVLYGDELGLVREARH